ncbi:hypothetical protein GCM10020295_62420 [Streptomyces cinereospinus]
MAPGRGRARGGRVRGSARGGKGEDGPGLRTELREAVVIAVALVLGGALLGVVWSRLAPRVPLVGDVVNGAWVVYLEDTEGGSSRSASTERSLCSRWRSVR